MKEYILLLPILVSFLSSVYLIPHWIKRAHNAGLVGRDMNKPRKVYAAEAGGVIVIASFMLGVLLYIALKTFYFGGTANVLEIFALLTSVLLVAFIGMIDDLLGWKIGLRKRIRLILVAFAAIPLMVINAGVTEIALPFAGKIMLGAFYTLFLIPLGIVGASTTFNFLA